MESNTKQPNENVRFMPSAEHTHELILIRMATVCCIIEVNVVRDERLAYFIS